MNGMERLTRNQQLEILTQQINVREVMLKHKEDLIAGLTEAYAAHPVENPAAQEILRRGLGKALVAWASLQQVEIEHTKAEVLMFKKQLKQVETGIIDPGSEGVRFQ